MLFCYFFCKVGRREIRRFCTEVNKQVNNIADFLGRIQRQEAQEKGCYPWQRSPPKRKGALVSYKFRVCVGRDAANKQIFRCTTWPVPQGLSPAKAAKAAKRAAEAWERETRAAYEYDLRHPQQAQDRETSRLRTDFASFVRHTWFPLCMEDGAHKPKTVAFYEDTMRNIVDYFQGHSLQKMQGLDLQRFLAYLRTERGSALSMCSTMTAPCVESSPLPRSRD